MIFFKNRVSENNEDLIYFEALEDDKGIGSCVLLLEDKYANVIKLDYTNEAPYAVEGLLKSAYNFACLRNYYMAKCSAEGIDAFLERMGFQKTDGEYINDIPTILMGSCGSCHSK